MSSYTLEEDLWIERSRLIGMILGGVSYGVFLLLTVQSLDALMRCSSTRRAGIADIRLALIFYIVITFALGTISTGVNIKYTEMIWINLRDAPGGPIALIENPCRYRINVLALSCGHIQEWFMQALLLHRCFVIWSWTKLVTIPMVTGYIAMIGLSITVQAESVAGTMFYNINTELAYLCIQVALNVIYTVLVVYRLFSMRSELKQVIPDYDSSIYDTVVLMIVESAMAYTILATVFIIAFALHNEGLSTLCFMSIGKVQGIAQLFIILRVARGRSITDVSPNTAGTVFTTVNFARPVLDGRKDSIGEGTARQDRGIDSASEKAADTDGSMGL